MPGFASAAAHLRIFFPEPKNFTLPSSSSSLRCSFPFTLRSLRSPPAKFLPISCHGSSSSPSGLGDDRGHQFLEASVLVSETTMHYKMRSQGFRENSIWQSSRHSPPFAVRASESRVGVSTVALGFLRQFKYPTIFLKISCDGDYLLPIIVGDAAVEKLLHASCGNENEECPDQFEFVAAAVDKLGYEVQMVKITNRVVDTYYAKLCVGKHGNDDLISIDARPSDAINFAKACQAPIYVNKEIVLADAIRIGYGGRPQSTRPIFDVILDSAPEGADPLTEELKLVRNMNLAAEDERYNDAAMWRDRLKGFLDSIPSIDGSSITPDSYDK
ncbi:PREDICTED: bifunctional nuclease 1-like [Tarenaya hassleriana]|uniref:bifunctional nuclease 1-like n=1 Tax=Tarenaya hassleriana TaxID=28532 RepID=UPI00053C1D9D|nr:PREDICTED: bifunctional nuclease 1-like [Tarenaya hassleriana]